MKTKESVADNGSRMASLGNSLKLCFVFVVSNCTFSNCFQAFSFSFLCRKIMIAEIRCTSLLEWHDMETSQNGKKFHSNHFNSYDCHFWLIGLTKEHPIPSINQKHFKNNSLIVIFHYDQRKANSSWTKI